MNITALTCYLTVCETRNFTKAAEKCFISPQGVSKTVKKLEQELDCQLFRRTSQGLELTESGAALQLRARRILEETRFLQEELERIADREETRIGLGIAMGTAQVMGRDFMERLQRLLSEEGLTSVDAMDLMCESEVLAQRYAMAITAGPVDPDKFDIAVLRRGHLCAFVHEGHPFYQKESLEFKDLKDQRLVTTNPNYRTYHQLTAACRAEGFEPDIIATTITVRDTCRAELFHSAVGISTHLILGKTAYDGFRVIPIESEKFGWNLELISKRGSRPSAKIGRVFRKIIDLAG